MTLLEVRFELRETRDTIKYAITIDLSFKTKKKKKKMKDPQLCYSQALFGRGENREDEKEVEENKVENGTFPYLVQEKKQE